MFTGAQFWPEALTRDGVNQRFRLPNQIDF